MKPPGVELFYIEENPRPSIDDFTVEGAYNDLSYMLSMEHKASNRKFRDLKKGIKYKVLTQVTEKFKIYLGQTLAYYFKMEYKNNKLIPLGYTIPTHTLYPFIRDQVDSYNAELRKFCNLPSCYNWLQVNLLERDHDLQINLGMPGLDTFLETMRVLKAYE